MDKSNPLSDSWYLIDNAEEVYSPALLLYPDRIEQNIRKMIITAGDVKNLRPHVKTHKMPEITNMLIRNGISKFKCATIAEAEMVAGCGAEDILLAYQPVGPNIVRFLSLMQQYPAVRFSCIADSEEVIRKLSESAVTRSQETHIRLDINVGMNRTGVPPGERASELYKLILSLPMLKADGLHVYDGHIHETNYNLRTEICNDSFRAVTELINMLNEDGIDDVPVIAGGSPTFPIHARRKLTETSPGTILLWDYGYSSSFADMDYLHAAVLFTRIISKPAKELICIDLGHKAVASEMPHPRIMFPGLRDYKVISHSEEHMVIRLEEAEKMKPGDHLYAIPVHICPTIDRYDTVSVVTSGRVSGEWSVAARKRKISI